jgi:putative transposase
MGIALAFSGLWQPGEGFEYALAQGGFKGKSYIEVMDWVAQKAAQNLGGDGDASRSSCRITGRCIKAVWCRSSGPAGRNKGCLSSFYPPYCSEMNPIETQWRQLKAHEIAGQMFDNEYDLAMTVIEGMESRSQVGDYTLERFRFNCA